MPKDQTDPETEAAMAQIADTINAPNQITAAMLDPLERGMNHIRAIDPDALAIWSVKGPKKVGGTISAVLINSTEVVILHQLASGKFKTFRVANLKADDE